MTPVRIRTSLGLSIAMRRLAFLVLPVCLACATARPSLLDEVARHREQWDALNIEDYRYEFWFRCFCPRQPGVRVTVRGDETTAIRHAYTGDIVQRERSHRYMTVDQAFALLQDQEIGPDDELDVVFHPDLHYPVHASFEEGTSVDVWFEFAIRDLEPTDRAPEDLIPTPSDRAVRGAVLRYLLEERAPPNGDAICVQVTSLEADEAVALGEAVGGERVFHARQECTLDPLPIGLMRHTPSGRPAIMYSIDSVRWLNDHTARAYGSWSRASLYGGSCAYTVARTDSTRWQVIEIEEPCMQH